MKVAVATVAAGRHAHLARQHVSLSSGDRSPDLVVVTSVGDPQVASVVDEGPLAGRTTVVELSGAPDEPLPLAAARNAAVEVGLAQGADLVVLLDVDCLATPGMLGGYERAAAEVAALPGSHLLCGTVAYLSPPADQETGYRDDELADARPHHARPAPGPGELVALADWRLFWSLSFAVSPRTWQAVGGFDESYTGYGGEDTDFGQRAKLVDVHGWWLGALALHQWHPVSRPPVEHLEDILRNANLFKKRWGWFPMEGWLAAFEQRGLARLTPTGWEPVR